MKSAGIVSIALAIILLSIACNNPGGLSTNQSQPIAAASPVSTATPDEFANARANFEKHCTACHGEEGKGGLVKIDDVKLKVPSLREGHALHHPDEKFVKQITNGGDAMPKFSDKLKPEEISDLVRFIRHEFQGK